MWNWVTRGEGDILITDVAMPDGNAFEVMFLSAADFFYDGSIYAAMEPQDRTTAIIAMLMTGVLLLGMLRRERTGPAGIGFESVLVLLLYAGSVVLIFL